MKIVFLLFIAVFGLGCYEYEFPEGQHPLLVINGEFSTRNGAMINVSKSLPATLDSIVNLELFLNDCTVELIDMCNNEAFVCPSIGNGNYQLLELKPSIGCEYYIRVTHPSISEARSEIVRLISPIDIVDVQTKFGALNTFGGKALNWEVTLNDDPNNDNYYRFSLDHFGDNNPWGVVVFEDLDYECQVPDTGLSEAFVSDVCASNGVFTIPIKTIYGGEQLEIVRTNELIISEINKEFYEYINALEQPEGFFSGIESPRITTSNIIGGYGIFVIRQDTSFVFEL